jgi:hypothetical protein
MPSSSEDLRSGAVSVGESATSSGNVPRRILRMAYIEPPIAHTPALGGRPQDSYLSTATTQDAHKASWLRKV